MKRTTRRVGDELHVFRNLPIEKTSGKTWRGVHAGELHMLVTMLRGGVPLTKEFRKLVAVALEKLFYGKAGQPSAYAKANRDLRLWRLQVLIENRVTEMKRNGENPQGGRKAKAREDIAAEVGIDPESLRKRFQRHKQG